MNGDRSSLPTSEVPPSVDGVRPLMEVSSPARITVYQVAEDRSKILVQTSVAGHGSSQLSQADGGNHRRNGDVTSLPGMEREPAGEAATELQRGATPTTGGLAKPNEGVVAQEKNLGPTTGPDQDHITHRDQKGTGKKIS